MPKAMMLVLFNDIITHVERWKMKYALQIKTTISYKLSGTFLSRWARRSHPL